MSKSSTVIIGSGLAGLSAAIEAYDAGCEVTLIEKNPRLGGNSQYASSGINAVGSKAQKASGIADTPKLFSEDTVKSGRGKCVESLVDLMVAQSSDGLDFLTKYGVDTSVLSLCGGHSATRTHRAKPRVDGKLENMGGHIIKALIGHVEACDSKHMRIFTNTKAEKLITNAEGEVVGVQCSTVSDKNSQCLNLFADSVILATGGYSSSDAMLTKYADENVRTLPTTNGPFAEGEGVIMAEAIGADLVDMNAIQVHPTGIVAPKKPFERKKFLAPEAFRGYGGILVNEKGKRFVDELTYRDVVSDHIFKNCGKYDKDVKPGDGQTPPTIAYLLLNKDMVESFGVKLFSFYKDRIGLITEFESANAASKFVGCEASVLEKTLSDHAKSAKEGKDEFGKTSFFGNKKDEPFTFDPSQTIYVIMVTPSIHYTMGGIRFNDKTQVLKADGSTIVGLYAAGEVTGGLHGENRLGGNSLLECVVFGRIAGKQAATLGDKHVISSVRVKPDFIDAKGVLHKRALQPDAFVELTLKERSNMNEHNVVFTFAFPDPTDHAGLYTGQYIAVKKQLEGKDVVRFYSPISRTSEYGVIKLLIKIEKAKLMPGSMCKYFDEMKVGDTLEFKGPLGGLEYHRNKWKKVGMIAGGTGISPMVQLIRSVTRHPEDTTDLTLLYGNFKEDDILCRDTIMYYTITRENINMYITLVEPPPLWTMGTGFITKEMIEKHLPPPGKDVLIVLCGPPPMIKIMKKYLEELKYEPEMIFSYI